MQQIPGSAILPEHTQWFTASLSIKLSPASCCDREIASASCRSSSVTFSFWLLLRRACCGSSDSARNGVSVPVVPNVNTFLCRSMMHWGQHTWKSWGHTPQCATDSKKNTLLFKHKLNWWSDNVIVKAWRNVNIIPWMVLLLYLNCCFYCLVEGIGTKNLQAVL